MGECLVLRGNKLSGEQLLQDMKVSHGSILGTWRYGGAEWIWLERWLGNTVTGLNAWEQWGWSSIANSMPTLRSRWQPLIEKRHAYLERLRQWPELTRDLTFKRLTEKPMRFLLVQQLQHVALLITVTAASRPGR